MDQNPNKCDQTVVHQVTAHHFMPDLSTLTEAATAARTKGPPPVHLWNPAFCGDIDMRIASNGTWFYQGTPIGRPALVRLFASILRKDPERYVLVTPVERVGIVVEDAPFLAVEMDVRDGGILAFRTNVDDWTEAGTINPIRFEREDSGGLKPYIRVRADLWAKATRAVYLDIVERAEERDVDGVAMLGVASGEAFFPMAPVSELDSLT
jgi:uncharacterized protein